MKQKEMVLPNWMMLVVDDDEMLCESAVHALRSIGIDAHVSKPIDVKEVIEL